MQNGSAGFPEAGPFLEAAQSIRRTVLEKAEIPRDPTRPIDPSNPFVLNSPPLMLWQAAVLLGAISNHRLMIPAERAMERVQWRMGNSARPLAEIFEDVGLLTEAASLRERGEGR
jgi:hypothetical protein